MGDLRKVNSFFMLPFNYPSYDKGDYLWKK